MSAAADQVTLDIIDAPRLLDALVRMSAELQALYCAARRAGREDVAREIRAAGVDVADAIALVNRTQQETAS